MTPVLQSQLPTIRRGGSLATSLLCGSSSRCSQTSRRLGHVFAEPFVIGFDKRA